MWLIFGSKVTMLVDDEEPLLNVWLTEILNLLSWAKEKAMSLKSKKFERGVIASGSAENLSAKRPSSAKSSRPSSADASKYSARSNASLVSVVRVRFCKIG